MFYNDRSKSAKVQMPFHSEATGADLRKMVEAARLCLYGPNRTSSGTEIARQVKVTLHIDGDVKFDGDTFGEYINAFDVPLVKIGRVWHTVELDGKRWKVAPRFAAIKTITVEKARAVDGGTL